MVVVPGEQVKVAVTCVAAVTVTTQAPVPEQPPPDHPANTLPVPVTAALSVTTAP